MKGFLIACVFFIACGASAQSGDVLGVHDLSASGAPVKGAMSSSCLYCHVPHSGVGKGPLWGQTFSSQTYTLYSSSTLQNASVQPTLGGASTLCLSCHDGTVAPGQMVPYGQITTSGKMTSLLSSTLEGSHPFSLRLPLKDSASLVDSIASSQTTADPTKSVQLVKGNVECTSCHNPHIQSTDKQSPNFLVRDNAKGGICLSCHETTKARTVNAQNNPLSQWTTSVHATASAQVSQSAGLGGYPSVADLACQSCHAPHNAVAASGLLRNPAPPMAKIDSMSQSCIACHNGSNKLVQPIANVFAEFEKNGHPYPNGSNTHSPLEPVVLVQNRHAACADCHNAHAAQKVTAFTAAPAVRQSQIGVAGVASDGSALTGPASNQYEICLRCHGNSSGKQALSVFGYLPVRVVATGDPLNLISQFGSTAVSAHPVMRAATGQSQPSLLGTMWDLTGKTPMRTMGTRVLCTDCHNSDDNREFGGAGPNGPHGSTNWHILERRYELSQVAVGAGPGTLVINLYPSPALDPASGGPYSLCAKCHNLTNVNSNVSFRQHSRHIQDGFSCSVCHTSHGVPSGGSLGVTGEHLVNFDVNVVAPKNNQTITYNTKNNSCTLVCHNHTHNNSK